MHRPGWPAPDWACAALWFSWGWGFEGSSSPPLSFGAVGGCLHSKTSLLHELATLSSRCPGIRVPLPGPPLRVSRKKALGRRTGVSAVTPLVAVRLSLCTAFCRRGFLNQQVPSSARRPFCSSGSLTIWNTGSLQTAEVIVGRL